MKIRRPANLSGVQLGLVTILGVFGGIYIWKPYFVNRPAPATKPSKELE